MPGFLFLGVLGNIAVPTQDEGEGRNGAAQAGGFSLHAAWTSSPGNAQSSNRSASDGTGTKSVAARTVLSKVPSLSGHQ